MILAIDIGNTNIFIGAIDNKKTYFVERITTTIGKTNLEYAITLKSIRLNQKRLKEASYLLWFLR